MSHFTVMRTKFTDPAALLKALADQGFRDVEVHEQAQHLRGFMGDVRKHTAEVIIRRKYVGQASNDIGFKKQPDGTYDAVISSYDRHKYSQEWLNRLAQRYAYHVTREKLEAQGFALVEENVRQTGEVHLVLRRVG